MVFPPSQALHTGHGLAEAVVPRECLQVPQGVSFQEAAALLAPAGSN